MQSVNLPNPWCSLPQRPPYFLPEDRAAIDEFNARPRTSIQYRIEPDVLPEPYVGSVNAPVVLLNLNPGFAEENRRTHKGAAF